MRQLLCAILFCLMISNTVRGVDFDASLLKQCQALAETPNNEHLRAKFMQHENITAIKDGFGKRFKLSFEQITKQKARLDQYAILLPELEKNFSVFTEQATAFLGRNTVPDNLKISLVCGTRWDAFGFPGKGQPQIFLNLALINPDFMPYLLRHEIWHTAFRNTYPEFAEAHNSTTAPLKQLAYTLLNEGVGHYYSFQRRVEPSIVYNNWQERTSKVFALLEEGVSQLQSTSDKEEQEEILFSSHAGVSFWKKWGALPGAVITYRLRNKLGTDEMKSIVAKGPCEFLSRYQREASQIPNWETIPDALLKSTCAS